MSVRKKLEKNGKTKRTKIKGMIYMFTIKHIHFECVFIFIRYLYRKKGVELNHFSSITKDKK